MAALPDNCLDRSIILPPHQPGQRIMKERFAFRISKLDVAASATGWSEAVSGREFHPLKSSAFRGALLQLPFRFTTCIAS
jgi:hypothetical protein